MGHPESKRRIQQSVVYRDSEREIKRQIQRARGKERDREMESSRMKEVDPGRSHRSEKRDVGVMARER